MKEETTITFLASECGEFHGMGECIECTSLKEAFRHYQRFCKRSPHMGSVFGIFSPPCRRSAV